MRKIMVGILAMAFLFPFESWAGYSSAIILVCNGAPTTEPRVPSNCYYQNYPVWINPPPIVF